MLLLSLITIATNAFIINSALLCVGAHANLVYATTLAAIKSRSM